MSRMFTASSFAALAAAMVLMFGSARLSSAAEDKKADDKKAEAAKTGSVSGTVTGADGNPAKDVPVRLYANRPRGERGGQQAQSANGEVFVAADKPADGEKPAADRPRRGGEGRGQRQQALKESKTNDKGEFTLADVPAGEYAVSASQGNNSARERVTVKAGETAKVTLALKAREAGRGNRGNQNDGGNQNQGGDAAKKGEGAAK